MFLKMFELVSILPKKKDIQITDKKHQCKMINYSKRLEK